jgi:sulfotransferase
MKEFVCLSGLPRTGSTLLSAILSQNPDIHAEGNSAVCQIMWDLQQSCTTNASEQIMANNRLSTIHDLVSSVPTVYYKNINESIILDKCRSWTIPSNFEMLKKYVSPNVKIIVLERPITEIVKSFAKLYRNNNVSPDVEENMLKPNSEPIMRSLKGLDWAKKNNQNNNFLFISYDNLINDTEKTIEKIYDFCAWKPFTHDFNNVFIKYPENDAIYNIIGQHTIRSKVEKLENSVEISDKLKENCAIIDKILGYTNEVASPVSTDIV